MLWLSLFLVYVPLCMATINLGVESGSLVPFHLHLLESIAAVDFSLYPQSVHSIVNEEHAEEYRDYFHGDELIHVLVHNAAELNEIDRSLVDLKTAAKFYSPRIQAHYTHYHDIEPQFSDACRTDTFGSKLNRRKSDAWLRSGDRIYCTPDDLFALELSKNSDLSQEILPFDRIIGSNEKTPVLVLYGDLHSRGFKQMFDNLYQSAEAGKLRFVWRYMPSSKSPEILNDYAAILTLKDDEPQTSPTLAKKAGLKIASKVLTSNSSPRDKYTQLKSILSDYLDHIDDLHHVELDEQVTIDAAANEAMGSIQDLIGIYLNGAPVNWLEIDVFNLINRIEQEVGIIQEIMELGFDLDQARTLIIKFALNAAVKLSEYNSGDNDIRYEVYKHNFVAGADTKKGGVAFFNDLESDEAYKEFPTSRESAYLRDSKIQGRLPPLKENVHDLIFVVNLSDKDQLKVFFTYSKVILDNGMPQQLGVLPFGDTEIDKTLAKYFYFLYDTTSPVEALAFLYKVYSREDDTELEDLLDLVPIDDYQFSGEVYERTLETFSIDEPSVIYNGVISPLASEWRTKMARQLGLDVDAIRQGLAIGEVGYSTKSYIHRNSKLERNFLIFPKDSSGFKYKKVTAAMVEKSVSFRKVPGLVTDKDVEFWIIGDLSNHETYGQLKLMFEYMRVTTHDVHLRVIDLSKSGLLDRLYHGLLDEDQLEDIVKKLSKGIKKAEPDLSARKFVSEQDLPSHHSYILVNSRYLRINKAFSVSQLHEITNFELEKRLSLIDNFMSKYPEIFQDKSLSDFFDPTQSLKFHDWKDLLISRIMKSFHVDDDKYIDDVARFDFTSLNIRNSFVIDNSMDPLVDVLVIVDPMIPYSQEILNLMESCISLPFVRTRVLIQPQAEYANLLIRRYYKSNFPKYPLNFSNEGAYIEGAMTNIQTPFKRKLSLDLDVPKRWVTLPQSTSKGVDLDNLLFDSDETVEVRYELSNILVEGYATDVATALPPRGLTIQISGQNSKATTSIMATWGYFQLSAGPGTWFLEAGISDGYDLLSASSNPFDASITPQPYVPVNVFTLDGLVLRPRVIKSQRSVTPPPVKNADINIFTITSGLTYEQLAATMMSSVMEHTESLVKFWLVSNYISPQFKSLLPVLAEELNFDYELVTYKWPIWLRHQVQRHRKIWGYKMLFLDVLFPLDLDQIIFVDADQINRSDMKELADLDMGDAPYGFVPMCDDRDEMEGFRFWKTGYWQGFLKEDLKYHISALYKVNLAKFREIGAGDRLRSHYQKLSSDKSSLSNLDQDLPNNMQRSIPIYSLPQEYLWCETWCSDETKDAAKNIDLCSNPLSFENKIDAARRLIPEWEQLDNKIKDIQNKIPEQIQEIEQDDKEESENEFSNTHLEDESLDAFSEDEWENDEL